MDHGLSIEDLFRWRPDRSCLESFCNLQISGFMIHSGTEILEKKWKIYCVDSMLVFWKLECYFRLVLFIDFLSDLSSASLTSHILPAVIECVHSTPKASYSGLHRLRINIFYTSHYCDLWFIRVCALWHFYHTSVSFHILFLDWSNQEL